MDEHWFDDKRLIPIEQPKLKFLSCCIDQIVERARDTLDSTPHEIRRWLRSPLGTEPDQRPFKVPQEHPTVRRYVGYWKQFTFYCFRTGLLDNDVREEVYGIRFTEEQMELISTIWTMLAGYNEDEFYERYTEDEDEDNDEDNNDDDDDDDEEEWYDCLDGELDQWNTSNSGNEGTENGIEDDKRGMGSQIYQTEVDDPSEENRSGEANHVLLRISENLFKLFISIITQRFHQGEELHSPLIHFSSVLGIRIDKSGFREPYNYTTFLAGLLWISRLLVLDYALPKKAYKALGWLSRSAYEDHGLRFEEIRRTCLVRGCYGPVSYLLSLLGYGKVLTKIHGRPGEILWDDDGLGFQIRDIYMRLPQFQEFVSEVVKSARNVMHDQLFFGIRPPPIMLGDLRDRIANGDPGYSIIDQVCQTGSERGGHRFMLELMMVSADGSQRLMDEEGRWDLPKCKTYLNSKKRFLQLLMLGIRYYSDCISDSSYVYHRGNAC